MDVQYYIGIDVIKATLDWAVFNGKAMVLQTQSLNSVAAIKAMLKTLKAIPGFTTTQSVFCLEHTGVYNALILDQLIAHQLPTCGAARRLESSLHIKQAGGLQRGKSDSIDAQRIADRVAGAICLSVPGSYAVVATTPSTTPRISHTQCFTAATLVGSATVASTC